jgi:hypothetical protein
MIDPKDVGFGPRTRALLLICTAVTVGISLSQRHWLQAAIWSLFPTILLLAARPQAQGSRAWRRALWALVAVYLALIVTQTVMTCGEYSGRRGRLSSPATTFRDGAGPSTGAQHDTSAEA